MEIKTFDDFNKFLYKPVKYGNLVGNIASVFYWFTMNVINRSEFDNIMKKEFEENENKE